MSVKYPSHQPTGLALNDADTEVVRVPPISDHGQPDEIITFFGGAEKLRNAVNQLQTLLYAA